jgi:hypothetical protein
MNDLATRLRRLADTRRRGHSVHPDVLREAANAIDNLTAERDEARREICQWEHHWDKTSSEQYYADKRGWDCFKGDKPCQ